MDSDGLGRKGVSSSMDRKQSVSYSMATGVPRRTKLQSLALTQAMTHVKDFMTDSQKALVLLREGKNYMDTGDIKGALDCFNQGICYNPSVLLFNLRASCHKQLDMYKEAYFDYSFNIRLEPEVGAHYCNRGLCLAKLKKASLAMEDMDLGIRYDPSASHFYSRATVFAEFGRGEDAIADFTSALSKEESEGLNQDFLIKCRYRRALAYFDLKQFDEVINDAQEVLKLDAANVTARALMGRAFKILNEHHKAEHQLTEAIILDENQAALYTERGDIRFRTEQRNKIIEAIYDFDKAATILEAKLAVRINDPVATSVKAAKFNFGALNLARTTTPSDSHSTTGSSTGTSNRSGYTRQAAFKPFNMVNRNPEEQIVSTTAMYFRDIEEQLADTLYKRAQAKLIIDPNPANIAAALEDALRAVSLVEEDDDYQLVAATCYIRSNNYPAAIQVLETVLKRSPRNQKALYNMAFCRRACGSQRDAIEGLSKIISMKNHPSGAQTGSPSRPRDSTSDRAQVSIIPLHRVYEMRGTLFYEINAHKLALMDLGKAIAINPSNPGNYFLRGDCHCKLGDYEQALMDYDYAESKGFEDACALYLSRGSVRRLLHDITGALSDFSAVYKLISSGDRLSKARVLSFCAFCHVDLAQYEDAMRILHEASRLTKDVLAESLAAYQRPDSPSNPEAHLVKAELKEDLLYLQRMHWILRYHLALAYYMTKQFALAAEILRECLGDTLRAFIPDDIAKGTVHFFLGQCLQQLSLFEDAREQFILSTGTHFADSNHNCFLAHFAEGKVLQNLTDHEQALEKFNFCLTLQPQSAHCLFRRAWSHKALGNYTAAGEDFETAKILRPNDPNFALDYKRIAKCEFMVIYSDPDLVEPFPSLLPVPGLQTSMNRPVAAR